MAKHHKRARKVKILKIENVEPDKTIVELAIEIEPVEIPAAIPAEPLELTAPQHIPEHKNWITWLKELW
jgi:hypothetical protein